MNKFNVISMPVSSRYTIVPKNHNKNKIKSNIEVLKATLL